MRLHELCSSNFLELDVLDDVEEVTKIDEDLTMTFKKSTGIAQPMKLNDDGLVKQENDTVTGDVAFFETVRNKSLKTISFDVNLKLDELNF